VEAGQRLAKINGNGNQNKSPEQLLTQLQKDVKDLFDRKQLLEQLVSEKQIVLDKLQSWDNSSREVNSDDVQVKREQVRSIEENIHDLQQHIEAALEKNPKLTVFRQASSIAQKKMKEREDERDDLDEEKRRLIRVLQEKESALESQRSKASNNKIAFEREKLATSLKEKSEEYRSARNELSSNYHSSYS
jgi:hypothetical protein